MNFSSIAAFLVICVCVYLFIRRRARRNGTAPREGPQVCIDLLSCEDFESEEEAES